MRLREKRNNSSLVNHQRTVAPLVSKPKNGFLPRRAETGSKSREQEDGRRKSEVGRPKLEDTCLGIEAFFAEITREDRSQEQTALVIFPKVNSQKAVSLVTRYFRSPVTLQYWNTCSL